jgi:hypothetical protein
MSRGNHINSLNALEKYRYKALEAKQRNKKIRLMELDIIKENKKNHILDLELKIFTIKTKLEEKNKYIELRENSFFPLTEKNLKLIINKCFKYIGDDNSQKNC